MFEKLLSPVEIGGLKLPNRIFMAPLTRNRAGDNDEATEMNAAHYAQRATAGLIVTADFQSGARLCLYPRDLHGCPGSRLEKSR